MNYANTKPSQTQAWNKGKLLGAKPPLKLKEIWTIRIRLELEKRRRDLALFNLGIDCKLRGCLALKIGPLEDNNFGRVFDIKSDPDSYTIGATSHRATLHTDNSFRNMPTEVIAIHCIRASDPGTGYSLFADGFNLAKKLERMWFLMRSAS